ncbi:MULTISPECIES: phosphotransferase [Phenylobacterium]|uniref:Ser/Thr protein kinase RdoA (MazF antagonist) n=1 Tax=Phenylobacterium koreense TaxID=266125 RepID=A0ABV2EMF1_9CAUL
MSAPAEIRILRPLAGGGGVASVHLVEVAGRLLVLKQNRRRDIAGERLFHEALGVAGLPRLHIEDHAELGPEAVLLEYVDGSPTIGGSPSLQACRLWGDAVGKLHHLPSAGFLTLTDDGALLESSWRDFTKALIHQALQCSRRSDLEPSLITEAERRLALLLQFEPESFVLAHGDLHLNNALIRNGDLVLFDKASEIWSAPAVFDLALIYSEAFFAGRYGVVREDDAARLRAFHEGYGELSPDQAGWLDHFVLLRSLRRYPSPFVPQLGQVIETALERLRR